MELPTLPEKISLDFAREWLKYFGEDVSIIHDGFCWKDFCKHYGHRLDEWLNYLEKVKTGDPAFVLYCCKYETNIYINIKKYFDIIRNAETGDPAWVAFNSVKYFGMDKKICFDLIEEAKSGEKASAAYYAMLYLGMEKERAFRIIKNAKEGNPAWFAWKSYHYHGMSKRMAKQIIKKNKREMDFQL